MTKRLGGLFLIVLVVCLPTTAVYGEDNTTPVEKPERTESVLNTETVSGKAPKALPFSVQVEACLVKKYAEDRVAQLKKKGYQAYMFEGQDRNKKTWYAIRIGDYEEANKAAEAVSLFESREKLPAVVTHKDSLSPVRVKARRPKPTERVQEKAKVVSQPAKVAVAPAAAKPPVSEKAEVIVVPPAPVSEKAEVAVVPPAPVSPKEEEAAGPGQVEEAPAAAKAPVSEKAEVTVVPPAPVSPGEEEAAGPGQVEEAPMPKEAEKEQEIKGFEPMEQEGEEETEEVPKLKDLQQQLEVLQEEVQKLRQQAEARQELKTTEEEAAEKEREILEAVSREYTMARKGTIGANYSFSYSYNYYDYITEAYRVEHSADHNLTNTISLRYALKDNFTVNTSIPFVYEYDKVGTAASKQVTDFGDISFGWQWQPLKKGVKIGVLPAPIVSGSVSLPLGGSPYETVTGEELSTGSGTYAAGLGMSMSGQMDPLVAFGGLRYSKALPIKGLSQRRGSDVLNEVKPGGGMSLNFGIGYALSYKVSLNMSFNYSYSFGTDYTWNNGLLKTSSGSGTSASFGIGTGWHVSPTRSINIGLGFGITGGSSFSFSFSTPLDFTLGKK